MQAKGEEIDWSPGVLTANAIDKSGILGWLMDVNGIAEKATFGKVGLSAFSGKEISRYDSRNLEGALLGPTFGLVGDARQSLSEALFKDGELAGRDVHNIRKLLPLQNLFYLRQLLDKVEAGVTDGLGLKPREAQ